MSRSCVFALVLCGLASICSMPGANAQDSATQYKSPIVTADGERLPRLVIGPLYDAVNNLHTLARKSVRSPSRRLRFGRRSDPDMPPQTPAEEMEELLSLRDVRTPVRLRFGRRSEEQAVPHIFPEEINELEMSPRELRTPLRLRFGRRSDDTLKSDEADEMMSLRDIRTPLRLRFGRRSDESDAPQSQKIDESDDIMSLRDIRTPLRLRFGRSEERAVPHTFPKEEQDRAVRAPSMRLRFGRRSDNNMYLLPYESALPKDVKANGSVEDDRQQE